jgi:hypothetical protein
VRPGRETSTHYFSSSGAPGALSIKTVPGHVTLNLSFCIQFDLWVMYCILVRSGREM